MPARLPRGHRKVVPGLFAPIQCVLSLVIVVMVGVYVKTSFFDRHRAQPQTEPRVVFSLTTIPKRIEMIKPVLDAIVEGQSMLPDVVYLAVPPEVKQLPTWLQKYNQTSLRPGVLKVLHMAEDYGPASKLLAAVAEGGERSPDTIIVYGDDDIVYSHFIVEQHVDAQLSVATPTAFGTRQISIGVGPFPYKRRERLLEATGTISLRASVVPDAVFQIQTMPPVCRLSDDYWISHHLTRAGVALSVLPKCEYDYNLGVWPDGCGLPFHAVSTIQQIEALSKTVMTDGGKDAIRSGGDWRSQLSRYKDCQDLLAERSEL